MKWSQFWRHEQRQTSWLVQHKLSHLCLHVRFLTKCKRGTEGKNGSSKRGHGTARSLQSWIQSMSEQLYFHRIEVSATRSRPDARRVCPAKHSNHSLYTSHLIFMFVWPCTSNDICIINQHDTLFFSLYCVTTPLHASGPFTVHHQEAWCIMLRMVLRFNSKSTVGEPGWEGTCSPHYPFKAQRFFNVPPGLTFKFYTWCSLSVESFVWISQ
jgi:hypothetical protein